MEKKLVCVEKKLLLDIAKELKGKGRPISNFDRIYRRGVDDLLATILIAAKSNG